MRTPSISSTCFLPSHNQSSTHPSGMTWWQTSWKVVRVIHLSLFPATVTTSSVSSVHLSVGCQNGNFGTSFLPCMLLAAAERSPPRLQAIYDSCDLNLLLHDIFIRVRECPSVLANSRDVLLRLVCIDHEKTITVSCLFFKSQRAFPTTLQTHDQVLPYSLRLGA